LSQVPSFNAKDLVRLIGKYGWTLHDQSGSHAQFTHPVLPGKVTIERHAAKDLPVETTRGVFKHAGMEHFYKMFAEGKPWRVIEKAIQAEAGEKFTAPAAVENTVPAALQPVPQIS
jgi:predicted RNA binding protein YcfA (HicA-like mRNA interferase family)